MKSIYLIIVVDQEGDPDWDVAMTKNDAVELAKRKQETAFDKPKIYEIDLATLAASERNWTST